MKQHVWAGFLAVVITIVLLVACSQSSAIEAGQTAPDFSLNNIDGHKVSLADFKGKAVILNFFASWCPPCRSEIPDFIELQKTYGDKGFTFVGVSLVSAQESKDFAAKIVHRCFGSGRCHRKRCRQRSLERHGNDPERRHSPF